MEQLAIDVRTPGVLRHGGQFVFQEIVDTPTYMLIALEDPRKPKPTRVVVDGVSKQIAKEALYKASAKLPIKTKTIKRFA